jgi:mannose-6-phosphate isomerase-like protein (cupin superfamily)
MFRICYKAHDMKGVIEMRAMWFAAALAISTGPALRSEIHDVLKNTEIEAGLTKVKGSTTVHQRPNFSISLNSQEVATGALETHDGADEVLFIRRGSGSLLLDDRKLEVGPGDVINVKRKTPHRIDAPSGRIEYVAVRVVPGEGRRANGIRPAPRIMPDVLRASEIGETFAKFDSNQPIHSAPNFTMNYVIYNSRVGPWEAHRGCVDIYFMRIGTAVAQLGGQIRDAKEESPGEIRGAGVTGARRHEIGPGDIVVIPRDTAHHMDPGAGKLGYLLMKIWAE